MNSPIHPTIEEGPANRNRPDTVHEGDRQFANTLARGLEVLRAFGPFDQSLGNKEISLRTGLPKPTISRLTYTLVELGYLRHDLRSGRYQLASSVLSLGHPLLASLHLRQAARPLMKGLADHCSGAVSMGLRERLDIVYVESCRSRRDVARTTPDIGTARPICSSTIGWAYLAACAPAEREAVLNQIKVRHPDDYRHHRSLIDRALQDIQDRGFCMSIGDLRPEVSAVGVPMRRTVDGQIVAFNCGMLAETTTREIVEAEVGPRLVALVREVESSLWLQ